MKRLLLSSLLSTATLAAALAGTYDSVNVGGFNYTFNAADKTATVESRAYALSLPYTGDIVIPSTVVYQNVTYTVTAIGQYFVSDYEEDVTSVTIPETVTTIESYAFDSCYLKELVIPNSVVTIGSGAFEYSELEKITLGSGVKSIDGNAFKNCSYLKEVTSLATSPANISATTFPSNIKSNITLKVPSGTIAAYQGAANWSGFKAYEEIQGGDTPEPEVNKIQYQGVWYELDHTTGEATVMTVYKLIDSGVLSAYYSGDLTIPETVPCNGRDYTVTALGDECFWQCQLTSLQLPSTLKKLGWESFYNITTLTELVIPDLVEVIEHGDFWAAGMKSVTLGSGVKTIEEDAFNTAYNLQSLIMKATTPPALNATGIPANVKSHTTLYVPKGTIDAYKSAPNWSGFFDYKVETKPIENPVLIDGIYYTLRTGAYDGADDTLVCSVACPTPTGTVNGDEYQGEINIPEFVTYDDQRYAVTSIDWYAFRDQTLVTAVTLPNTIKTIGNSAFQSTAITKITLPESVKTLENYVFMRCNSLTEITTLNPVPPTVSSTTFSSSLTSVCKLYVPRGCEQAYKNAQYWKDFSSIEPDPNSPIRPESITLSRTHATRLVGDTFTITATILPEDATDKSVEWKSLNPEVATVDASGVVTLVAAGRANIEAISNGDRTLSAMCDVLSITAEAEVDGINYRFVIDEENKLADAYVIRKTSGYSGDIVIPSMVTHAINFGVKGIDQNSFSLMSEVTSVTIPSSIESMGFNAFRECSGLQRVNISDISRWANIDFRDKQANPLQCAGNLYLNGELVTELTIPGSTETIKSYVFTGLKSMTSLKLEEGVKSIGTSAFEKCSSITEVSLPESVEEIKMSAFADCTSLVSINLPASLKNVETGILSRTAIEEIEIPEGVEYINNQAFQGCSRLKSVTLPSTLEMIYMLVWDGCTELSSISCHASVPPAFFQAAGFGDYAMAFPTSIFSTCSLKVPEESVSTYKTAEGWKNFLLISALDPEEKGVEAEIDGLLYELYEESKTATLIYMSTYSGEITVPAKVTYEDADYDVTTIGAGAFDGLEAVTAITLPESISKIRARAFAGTSVDVFTVPQAVTEIPEEMMADCTGLISLSLPDNLLRIGEKAFYGSPNIRYIFCNNAGTGEDHVLPMFTTYPDDPTDYGQAFSTEIWPDCMLVIPANMFANYKKQAGWKNFRSWGYWHDYDIMPQSVVLTPSELKGAEETTLTTAPSVEPADATVFNYILTGGDPEIATIKVDKDENDKTVYSVELLKEGETAITVYCGLLKSVCTIICDNSLSVNGIDADPETRWFDLNGFELKAPVKGQPMIRVRNGKSEKVIMF